MPQDDELLTPKDVAKILKCSRSQIYKLRRSGILLPRYQLFPGQRGWRWSLADIQDYLKRCEVDPRSGMIDKPRKFVPLVLRPKQR